MLILVPYGSGQKPLSLNPPYQLGGWESVLCLSYGLKRVLKCMANKESQHQSCFPRNQGPHTQIQVTKQGRQHKINSADDSLSKGSWHGSAPAKCSQENNTGPKSQDCLMFA